MAFSICQLKIALAGGLALGSLLMVPAPAVAQRVLVTAGGGVADIRGGGLVPGNREPVMVGRVTFDVTRWIGLDLEGSVTGESTSRIHYRRADWRWREVRREMSAAAYLRVKAWSHEWVSVEPVAGIGFLNARVQGWQGHHNPLINQWSEWWRGKPGDYGYDGFYAPYDLWVFGFGVDVALGSRRLAVVPEVRTLVPYTSAGGRFDGGVHTRAAIGLRAGF